MDMAQKLGYEFSGPIIFNYVWWILREAQQRGIKRLYFLARDGYTLRKVAESFCVAFHLPIECHYLYCSRMSLRMPSFFFIGEEMLDLLFMWGYYVTLKSILQRGNLTEEERKWIYNDCGLQNVDEDALLTRKEFDLYTSILRKSEAFRTCIIGKSRAAYKMAAGYLRQEGLLNDSQVALVDSGWTGSMQRSLRQLLEHEGYTGQIVGFYFGMYAPPRAIEDGIYQTWYFDSAGKTNRKATFCNNLFECILSAPHGMTTGYCQDGGIFTPVLTSMPEGRELRLIEEQSAAICGYAGKQIKRIRFDDFHEASFRKDTQRRIERYMARPTAEEAEYYGRFLFCDDVTEAYQFPMACADQKTALKEYVIPRRFLRKFLKRSVENSARVELFWPYGTIAFLSGPSQKWYRFNIYAWELLKQMLK